MRFSAEQANELATFFDGLSHPVRLQLVGLLLEKEHNVSELMQALGLPQARVSRHLQTLRHCGCCTPRQEDSWVYYRVPQERQVAELLHLAAGSLPGATATGERQGFGSDEGDA